MVTILKSALPALLLLLEGARGQRGRPHKLSKVGGLPPNNNDKPPGKPGKPDGPVAGAQLFPWGDDDDDEEETDVLSLEDDGPPEPEAAGGGCREKVVVIGGGFAGLTAARDLLLAGHRKVTLVESRPEVGGRTATVHPTNGTHTWHGIDLGAQWILGSEPGTGTGTAPRPDLPAGYNSDLEWASAAHELATLAGVPPEDHLNSWYPYGYRLYPEDRAPPDEVKNVSLRGQMFTPKEAVEEDFFAQCQRNWVRKGGEMNPVSQNWAWAYARDTERGGYFSEFARRVFTTSIQEQDYAGAVSVDDMWAGGCWEGISYTSDHNLRHGFAPVYEWMEANVTALGGRVLKNARVTKVQKSDGIGGRNALCRRGRCRHPIRVKVRNELTGKSFSLFADRVVSTVSLSILQDSADRSTEKLKFRPGLPATQRNALKSVSMGHLEKLVLFFPTMFWKNTRAFADRGFEDLYFLGCVPTSLAPRTMKWAGILFAVEHSSVVLWFSGDDAEEFMRGVPPPPSAEFEALKEELTGQAMDAIRDIFANDERYLDVNGDQVEVEEPYEDLTVLTNWMTDENFLGCYGYLNTRAGPNVTQYQQELGLIPDSYLYLDLRRNARMEGYSKDRLALGRPASRGPWAGRLFFAGEHTSLTAPGLVHGAVESGKRAAIEVNERTACGAPQVERVAVPYFESAETPREEATYQRWKEVRKEPNWVGGYRKGYRLLGFRGKEGYEGVGCTEIEKGLTFTTAEGMFGRFREGLALLNYTQESDDEYDSDWNWVGDYNCYIAHYNMWGWSDFQYYWWTTEPLETLGYDQDQWDYGNSTNLGDDPPFMRDWEDLEENEKAAAGNLCYTQYTWDFWGTFCQLY